mgnify:CR=1 FL=1
MISVGVSTACLHPQETAESIEYLCQHSIQSFEVFLNTSIYFRDGIHVLFSDYSPRLKDGLQLYEQYFRIQKIGGHVILSFMEEKKDSYTVKKNTLQYMNSSSIWQKTENYAFA